MPRDSKPAEIREANPNYRTKQLAEAGKEILEKWNHEMTFKKLAEEGEWTDGHYSNAWYENMGPVDDPKKRTFGEIKDTYGSVRNYYRKRDVTEAELDVDENIDFGALFEEDDLSKRDIFMIRQGYKIAMSEKKELGTESESESEPDAESTVVE